MTTRTPPKPEGERIAKVLARAGVGSRREVERMIAQGRIRLSGQVLDSPAIRVSGVEAITVDGRPVAPPAPARLWRYHKPRGRLTTAHDPQGRPTVFDDLPAHLGRVITVGRLDFNSEGLLLLTNDGELARWMELPATGWTRCYRVRAHGRVEADALAALADGVTIDGFRYGPVTVELERRQGANAWLRVSLREGRNREVRRVLEYLGLTVNRLIRISYGPFRLGELKPGEVRAVRSRVLADQLGAAFPHLRARPKPAGRG